LSEATITSGDGKSVRIVKGRVRHSHRLAKPSVPGSAAVKELEKQGFRVLAVAEGPIGSPMTLMGLIALSDPPRSDSAGSSPN